MSKKGIVLSELLAVLIILIIVFIIIMTTFFAVVSKSRRNLNNSQKEMIVNSAKLYLSNSSNLGNKPIYEVTLNELIKAEYLSNTQLINAITNEKIDFNSSIIVKYKEGRYNYKFVENYTNENLILNIDSYKPIKNYCTSIICIKANYQESELFYDVNNITIDLTNLEDFTISFYASVLKETNNDYYAVKNDTVKILDKDIPLETINKLLTYDIVKHKNLLTIYIDDNKVYEAKIIEDFNNFVIDNHLKVYNLRVYNTNLTRDKIIFNNNISREGYE